MKKDLKQSDELVDGLKGPILRSPSDVLEATSDRVAFKEWFFKTYNVKADLDFNKQDMNMFKAWMASRGWKV